MINLLPPNTKRTFSYARKNSNLVRACLAVVGVAIGVLAIVGAGHLYLSTTTERIENENADLQQSLQDQGINEVKAEIQDLSNSVNLALKVLGDEVLFSKLLLQAGSVMPNGSALSSLEISDDQKGVDISARVQNYQVGTQIQINLSDPENNIFEEVDLISVECRQESESGYPCDARLRGLLGDNSPYLFLNNATGDGNG